MKFRNIYLTSFTVIAIFILIIAVGNINLVYANEDVFDISGTINLDEKTGKLMPVFRYQGTVTQEVKDGEYAVELLNLESKVLATYGFKPTEIVPTVYVKPTLLSRILKILCKTKMLENLFGSLCSANSQQKTGVFGVRIPAQSGVTKISLKYGSRRLEELGPGPQSPTVRFEPVSLGKLPTTGEFRLSWSANDLDGDRLYYRVLFSEDNKKTWKIVSSGVPHPSFSWDVSRLRQSNVIFFQVLASDGVNTGSDIIGPFSSSSKLPIAEIITPKNGESVNSGRPVIFLGSGSDPEEDSTIPDDRLIWSSSVDGTLGYGQTLQLDKGLSKGNHQITLKVKDKDGNESSTTVNITVK